MKKYRGLPFTRLVNLLKAAESSNPKGALHPEALAILCLVAEQGDSENPVTVTKLVQSSSYGSLPTVLRRVEELKKAGLIYASGSLDRRLKVLLLTPQGEFWLRWYSLMMKKAIFSSD